MYSSKLYDYCVTIKKRRGSGSYKVHRSDCEYLAMASTVPLGEFTDCQSALKQANERFSYVEACFFCP